MSQIRTSNFKLMDLAKKKVITTLYSSLVIKSVIYFKHLIVTFNKYCSLYFMKCSHLKGQLDNLSLQDINQSHYAYNFPPFYVKFLIKIWDVWKLQISILSTFKLIMRRSEVYFWMSPHEYHPLVGPHHMDVIPITSLKWKFPQDNLGNVLT